jgi:hypothetical protein
MPPALPASMRAISARASMAGSKRVTHCAAASALGRPTSAGVKIVCRWRLLSATVSLSIRVSLPMPAVLQRGAADAAAADQHDMGFRQRDLTRAAHFGQDDMAGEAVEAIGGQAHAVHLERRAALGKARRA